MPHTFLNKNSLAVATGMISALLGGVFFGNNTYAAGTCNISTFSDFATCWTANSTETNIDITITTSFDLTGTVTVPGGKNATITSDSGQHTLTRSSSFAGNLFVVNSSTANSLTLTDIIIDGNRGNISATGPIIYNNNPADTITIGQNVILQNNNNATSNAGAVQTTGVLNIDGATITNNTATGRGGGVYSYGNFATVDINNAIITNNTATSSGGGVSISGGAQSITISGNTAIDGNVAGSNTGGLYIQAGTNANHTIAIITGDLSVSNNQSITGWGGIFVGDNAVFNTSGANSVKINGNTTGFAADGTTVINPLATSGGIHIPSSAITFNDNVEIKNNKAARYAGGMYIGPMSVVTLDGAIVSENIASDGDGGGIYIDGSSLNMISGDITKNEAITSTGGGIYVTNLGQASIGGNANIASNTAGIAGGGIANNIDSILQLKGNATIRGNTADASGGGIDNYGTLTIEDNVVISDNSVNSVTGVGGGITNSGTTLFPSSLAVTGGSIENNTAWNGGGIHTSFMPISISGNTAVKNNTAVNNGGGIHLGESTALLNISGTAQIISNSAGNDGGGIWVAYADLANVNIYSGVIFANNSASTYETVISPASQTIYNANIFATAWTTPFTHGYNNYDIAYPVSNTPKAPNAGTSSSISDGIIVSSLSTVISVVLLGCIGILKVGASKNNLLK